MDRLLDEAFDVQVEPPPTTPGHPTGPYLLAWRILLIARALQQAARIPVFEPGQVLGLQPDPENPAQWRADIVVPAVDFVSRRAAAIACRGALVLARWATQPGRNPANLAAVCDRTEKSVLQPLRRLATGGISTVPILNEAHARDIPFRHLGAGVFVLGWGRHARLMDRSASDADSAIGCKLVQAKHWSAQVLRAAGLPAPAHIVATSAEGARQAAARLGWPVVVKPADRERSEGVTVGIRDTKKLLEAYKTAAALSKTVLVEREVAGVCYRLLIANGGLLYAIRRKPKSVTADGQRSVAELVRRANEETRRKPTWKRGKIISLDAQAHACLAAQGLTAESVPRDGEVVALRPIESFEWGGTIEDASSEVHPDNIDIAVRAARLFGLQQAGVDLITTNISIPWHQSSAVINEVNYAPYLGGNPTAKSRLPSFLQDLMNGNGRIPVEAFVGGDGAMEAARARHSARIAAGVNCYLTSHAETLTGRGERMQLSQPGLFHRALALLLNRDVEALILVIQTDELLDSGWPVDRLDRIELCEGALVGWRDGAVLVDGDARTRQLRDTVPAASPA